MDKIYTSYKDAVADIPDGASVGINNWGFAGGPQNLILALRDHGARNLTLMTQNYIYTPFPEEMLVIPCILLPQLKKVIAGYFATMAKYAQAADFPSEFLEMESNLDFEVVGHGNFSQRLRAGASGMGPFYSPIGVGTVVEEGREKRTFQGKEYLLFEPLRPDVALVRADKADKYGNLVYKGTCQCLNPIFAMAGKTTIAEVDELVEPGELSPEEIVTPAAFVDRIVVNPPGGRGTYEYTMKKLHELLSVESIRNAFFAQAKQIVEEKEEN